MLVNVSRKDNKSALNIMCVSLDILVWACSHLVHVEQRKSCWIVSGPMRDCGVGCQCALVIWYLSSSTRTGLDASLMLPDDEAHGLRHNHTINHRAAAMNLMFTDVSHLPRLGLQLLEELNAVIMDLLQINAWMIVCGESSLWMKTAQTLQWDVKTVLSLSCFLHLH